MKRPELLAPAGSLEKAKIAFKYGADAVYAGSSKLSLRSRSEHDTDSLIETINYAHSINKKVYVAMNIYAMDENYKDIENEIKKLEQAKVDGIIVSDVGIIDKIKTIAPNIPVHISTQANTTSLESALFWYKYGAKRIILARELSKKQIEYIMNNKPKDLELEIFIHGAICFAYSGRCYMSKYLADRSANLGDCAQSCRWNYNLVAKNKEDEINIDYNENGTYLFSSKDMCLIKEIPNIVDMGIESLKIEGRLKTEYYLASVVRTYRIAIDEYMKLKEENKENSYNYDKYLKELVKVKTRGLSEFYFLDEENQDIHDLDGKSENLEYEYAGKVISVKDNITTIEIKNKMVIGDEIEILYPNDIMKCSFEISKMYDVETDEEIDVINPGVKGQLVKMYIPKKVENNIILRKRK